MKEIIWRYLDFAKFVDLLDRKALFFARGDSFHDPFEGSWTKKNFDSMTKAFKDSMPKAFKDLDDTGVIQVRDFFKRMRKYTFLSCWHLSNHESAAMWELYSKSNEGVAIQSSISRLSGELKKNYARHDLYISRVRYVDYSTFFMREGDMLAPFIHKRKSFEHEREVRAIVQQLPSSGGTIDWSIKPPEKGIYISLDLNAIIETVYVSPTSPKWFKELVQSIMNTYGYNISVKQSRLSDDPIF